MSAITDKKQQHVLLLHLAGRFSKPFPKQGTTTRQKNISFVRHTFCQALQQQQEPITDYVMHLKTLAATCEFPNKGEMIRDQVVDKCYSAKLRQRLLQEPSLTLDKVISIGHTLEVMCEQAKTIENASTSGAATLNSIHSRRRPNTYRMRRKQSVPHSRKPQNTGADGKVCPVCYCCGESGHKAKNPSCPALKGTCNACHNFGHFSCACQSSKKKIAKVREVPCPDDSDDSMGDGHVFVVGPQEYHLDRTPLATVSEIKDLDITVTDNLQWTQHIKQISLKAN